MLKFFQRLKGTRIDRKDVKVFICRVIFLAICYPFGPWGLILALVSFWGLEKGIEKRYGYEAINVVDKNVWYDQESNRCNIMSIVYLEKTTEAEMKKYFQHKMSTLHKRFRCKMVKVLDTYYFDEFKGEELKKRIEGVVTVLDNIKTREEIEDFMAKESNTAFTEDELQWHLWFIPNYNDNESLIIMKAHHIMADGMGWILTLGSL